MLTYSDSVIDFFFKERKKETSTNRRGLAHVPPLYPVSASGQQNIQKNHLNLFCIVHCFVKNIQL